MIELYDKATNAYIGKISEEELQSLVDNLEEESITDTDYYIDKATLEFLKGQGLSSHLIKLIEDAMDGKDEIEILYKKK